MCAMNDDVETVHLYVVREQPEQGYTLVPLLFGIVCLLGIAGVTLYSAQHPQYEQKRLIVPAIPLPVQTFTAEAPIISTGIKTYPATYAHGWLTFSNGSVTGLSIPQGFTVDGAITDSAVYVPPATANGFGISTASAHLLTSGINMSKLSINEVIGASLFVHNLSPFTSDQPAYSVKYVIEQDKLTAVLTAHTQLAAQAIGYHYLCQETKYITIYTKMYISWRCQFIGYKVPAFMHVAAARLVNKNFIVDVFFLPRPTPLILRQGF